MRVVLHDREDAVEVAARLTAAGFGAVVARERFAGEDDEEGHPWAVLTEAPSVLAELLAREYDGWVDDEETGPAPASPLSLPNAPRRGGRPGGKGPDRPRT